MIMRTRVFNCLIGGGWGSACREALVLKFPAVCRFRVYLFGGGQYIHHAATSFVLSSGRRNCAKHIRRGIPATPRSRRTAKTSESFLARKIRSTTPHNDGSPIVVAEAPALSLGNHRGPRLALPATPSLLLLELAQPISSTGRTHYVPGAQTDLGKNWVSRPNISTQGTGRNGLPGGGRPTANSGSLPFGSARRMARPDCSQPIRRMRVSPGPSRASSAKRFCECCHPSVTISADGRRPRFVPEFTRG